MICLAEDEFIYEKFDREARWIATLSNGLIVYQDDDRYGPKDPAWLRLTKYCKDNKLRLNNLRIQFRSNIIDFPEFEGYYYTKGAGADMNGGRTEHFFVIGLLNQGILRKTWWKTPEMSPMRTDEETIEEVLISEFAECLIR